MVKLTLSQQEDEIRDLSYHLKGFDDLQVVELQAQQVKRLIFFAKKGLVAHKQTRNMGPHEVVVADDIRQHD